MPCNEIKSANPFLRESFPEKITAAIDRPKVQSRSKEARIESNRPPVSAGRLDQRLAGLVLALRGMVAETQETFIYPACQLDNDALDELAVALVEFAEDIHAGIGLCSGIGKYRDLVSILIFRQVLAGCCLSARERKGSSIIGVRSALTGSLKINRRSPGCAGEAPGV